MGRFEVNLGRFAVMLGCCHDAVIVGRFSVYWVYWVVVRSEWVVLRSCCGRFVVIRVVSRSPGSLRSHVGSSGNILNPVAVVLSRRAVILGRSAVSSAVMLGRFAVMFGRFAVK
jgi:hypothetical protein